MVGVLASLYADFRNPEFRVSASQISAMTDDLVDGTTSRKVFRRTMGLISLSRPVGTILAQVLLLPAAILIAKVSAIL